MYNIDWICLGDSSFHYAVIFGKFLSWHLFLNVLYLEQPLFKMWVMTMQVNYNFHVLILT